MNKPGYMMKHMLLILLAITLPGCSKDLPRLSGTQLEAVNHNLRGIKAEARGDHDLALEEFSESLRIHSAIDNDEGRVVAMINMARVYRYKGDLKGAQMTVDKALQLVRPATPLFSEVAFEKSSLEIQLDNLPAALEWGQKSLAAADDSRPGSKTNLVARILFLQKSYAIAKEKAEQALALNQGGKDVEEEANSLRLLGDIHTATGHPDLALTYFEQALALDKKLGKSRKIAMDLQGIAAIQTSAAKYDQAIDMYQRAYSVSINGNDHETAAGDLLQLARLYDRIGKTEQSIQLLRDRDELLKKVKEP